MALRKSKGLYPRPYEQFAEETDTKLVLQALCLVDSPQNGPSF